MHVVLFEGATKQNSHYLPGCTWKGGESTGQWEHEEDHRPPLTKAVWQSAPTKSRPHRQNDKVLQYWNNKLHLSLLTVYKITTSHFLHTKHVPSKVLIRIHGLSNNLFTKKPDNSSHLTPQKCAFWSKTNRAKLLNCDKIPGWMKPCTVGIQPTESEQPKDVCRFDRSALQSSPSGFMWARDVLPGLRPGCSDQAAQTRLHRRRREGERLTVQSNRSAAPSVQAFSHVSVNTPGTNVTDMCTFVNNLESASDRGLVLIWRAGLHAKV